MKACLAPWDGESYCVEPGCRRPAPHSRVVGMIEEDFVTETICCWHSHRRTWLQALGVLCAVLAMAAAGCGGDEKDQPEPTTGPPPASVAETTTTRTAPFTTTPPTVAASLIPPVSISSDTTAAAPPATCGPDPDETHPPPCD